MTAEDDLAAAQAKLESLEERTREQRRYRNHTLRAALAAGVTWKRAGEVTGLSRAASRSACATNPLIERIWPWIIENQRLRYRSYMPASSKRASEDIEVPNVKLLLPEQLDLLEAQLSRQEDSMRGRLSATSARANVLIAASALLGGAGVVTAAAAPWLAGGGLAAYLLAAICGVVASRSRMGREPDLVDSIKEFAEYSTISLRRDLILRRLQAHDGSVKQLSSRHRWLVAGVVFIALAWSATAGSTVVGIATPSIDRPLIVEILHRGEGQ